jgi:hypothetical protein
VVVIQLPDQHQVSSAWCAVNPVGAPALRRLRLGRALRATGCIQTQHMAKLRIPLAILVSCGEGLFEWPIHNGLNRNVSCKMRVYSMTRRQGRQIFLDTG